MQNIYNSKIFFHFLQTSALFKHFHFSYEKYSKPLSELFELSTLDFTLFKSKSIFSWVHLASLTWKIPRACKSSWIVLPSPPKQFGPLASGGWSETICGPPTLPVENIYFLYLFALTKAQVIFQLTNKWPTSFRIFDRPD